MKVLVTGGAGYVGSVLVPLLLARGHQVRVLDRLEFGGAGLLTCCRDRNFSLMRGDIRNERQAALALRDVDAVVHLAALVGYPACRDDPQAAGAVNVDGTRVLLDLRRPDQRFLYASTGSVYGAVRGYLCREDIPLAPVTRYGETKAAAERLVMAAGNAMSLRYATAFGVSPRMRLDLLPNDFTYQAVHRGSLVVYESGARRTFIHVTDVARSILFALQRWPALVDDIYNVGHETLNLTKEDVAKKILSHVEYYLHFAEYATDADQRDYEVSYEKIRAAGFATSVDLDAGIAELVQAAKLMPSRL